MASPPFGVPRRLFADRHRQCQRPGFVLEQLVRTLAIVLLMIAVVVGVAVRLSQSPVHGKFAPQPLMLDALVDQHASQQADGLAAQLRRRIPGTPLFVHRFESPIDEDLQSEFQDAQVGPQVVTLIAFAAAAAPGGRFARPLPTRIASPSRQLQPENPLGDTLTLVSAEHALVIYRHDANGLHRATLLVKPDLVDAKTGLVPVNRSRWQQRMPEIPLAMHRFGDGWKPTTIQQLKEVDFWQQMLRRDTDQRFVTLNRNVGHLRLQWRDPRFPLLLTAGKDEKPGRGGFQLQHFGMLGGDDRVVSPALDPIRYVAALRRPICETEYDGTQFSAPIAPMTWVDLRFWNLLWQSQSSAESTDPIRQWPSDPNPRIPDESNHESVHRPALPRADGSGTNSNGADPNSDDGINGSQSNGDQINGDQTRGEDSGQDANSEHRVRGVERVSLLESDSVLMFRGPPVPMQIMLRVHQQQATALVR